MNHFSCRFWLSKKVTKLVSDQNTSTLARFCQGNTNWSQKSLSKTIRAETEFVNSSVFLRANISIRPRPRRVRAVLRKSVAALRRTYCWSATGPMIAHFFCARKISPFSKRAQNPLRTERQPVDNRLTTGFRESNFGYIWVLFLI